MHSNLQCLLRYSGSLVRNHISRKTLLRAHSYPILSYLSPPELCQSSTDTQRSCTKPEFVNLLRSPGIDSQPSGPVRQPYLTYTGPPGCYMGWRNWFLGAIYVNVYKFELVLASYIKTGQKTGLRELVNVLLLLSFLHRTESYQQKKPGKDIC
jgi:hypothetical protein